jgi:hypothetical protein
MFPAASRKYLGFNKESASGAATVVDPPNGVSRVNELDELEYNTLPSASMAMSFVAELSRLPTIVDSPLGVIFEILPLPELVVYTFPAPSTTIPLGPSPVITGMLATPAKIFVTLFESRFAMYTFPVASTVIATGFSPS